MKTPAENADSLQQNQQNQVTTPEKHADSHNEVLVLDVAGQKQLFDLGLAKQREAERRLAVLGIFAQQDFDKKHLREFAQKHFLPENILISWKQAFLLGGLEGLSPQDWSPLKEKSQCLVIERLRELGSLEEKLTKGLEIKNRDIAHLAGQHNWTLHKAERLVRRYQIDGIWGLAPERDPERIGRKQARPVRPEPAVASDKSKVKAEKRYKLIEPYLGKKRIPNEELRAYAEANDSSLETVRKYLRDYKAHGLQGLVPCEQRSDKGRCHNMSERMEGVVAGIRLTRRDLPTRKVHEEACQRAILLGEPEPTPWQVRRICDSIPAQVKEIADERYGDYRSKHRITYRYHFDGSVIVYQIDFTPVDVLLTDIRRRGVRTKSEAVRAYLITCVECSSRLIMAYLFTYDTPNSTNIATVLHDALTVSENKPYGGIPSAVWVDQGKQLISNHMQQIARDFHFDLHEGHPNFREDRGDPQKRGRVERPFRTFNTRLWSAFRGYTGSNTKERHPDVKAELTISELAAEFSKYVEKYHHEVHSETKETPLEFWAQHCFAVPADNSQVDFLLQELFTRSVSKGFIQYGGRRYWHDDLWQVPADAIVQIRAQPDYMRPDDIQVYFEGRRIGPAFALDSVAGRKVDGKRVLTAQRRQRKEIQQTIDKSKATLRQADQEIQSLQQDQTEEPSQASAVTKQRPSTSQAAKQRKDTAQRLATIPTYPTSTSATTHSWSMITQSHTSRQTRRKR
jgi:hypothetical protein